ncbi:diguanylate cyclase (GGDEF) domain-containing protein [Paenibacillaceae bacterium GAS479]|nr:diguanylate cyclase (GGDEF) domain-containing protein [Paenibacillaceae bacterium GAS479]
MIITASCLIASCLPIALAMVVFRYRQVPGASLFIVLALLSALLSFGSLMQYVLPEYEAKLFWRNITQIPLLLFPMFGLLFSMIYAGMERLVRPWLTTVLSVISLTALILIFTDESHNLMRNAISLGENGLFDVRRTSLNSYFLAYTQALHLIGGALLLKAAIDVSGRHRFQLLLMSGAMLLPVVSFSMSAINHELSAGASGILFFSLLPTSVVLFWALYRHQVLHVVQFARNKLIEMMKEGVVVLDTEQRIMDYNPSASRLLARAGGIEPGNWTAMVLSKLLPSASVWLEAHDCRTEMHVELPFHEEQVWLAITVTPLISGRGVYYGSLSVIADITETKKLEQDLRRRASIDGLTGVYNRDSFMERAQRHLSLCMEEGKAFSLLVLDLDFFKKINDDHGHQSGDMALKGFVQVVQRVVECRSLFGRVGGEEFAIALPDSDLEQAAELAELIRSSVMNAGVSLGDGCELQLTVSIGGSGRDSSSQEGSFQLLYSEADQALYRAKRSGRNKVLF